VCLAAEQDEGAHFCRNTHAPRKLIRMYLFSSVRMRKGNKKDTFSANLKVINHAYGLRKNVEKILQRNVIHFESGNNEKMHFL